MTLKLKKSILTRAKTLDFLEKLATVPDNAFQTIYLPPHLSTIELKNSLKELPSSDDIADELKNISIRSGTGAVIFWSTAKKFLVVPPFPVAEKRVIPSLNATPLNSLLNQKYHIGIVLIRLGSYAIGICRGDKLIGSKVGTGLVHGRHRQGGSSAHRFERHRDKQIESFLIRVCGHVREQVEPYAKTMDYIVYGGARTTILMLQKYCPLMGKLDKPTLAPLLDIPEPRRAVLETAVSRIWSSTIYSWTED
jgi:hypothetical protein